MPGWGDAVGWIFDRLPTKKESLRNEIEKTERKMYELTKKENTDKNVMLYEHLSGRLRKLQDRLKNI